MICFYCKKEIVAGAPTITTSEVFCDNAEGDNCFGNFLFELSMGPLGPSSIKAAETKRREAREGKK
jgi:hypothetical protein